MSRLASVVLMMVLVGAALAQRSPFGTNSRLMLIMTPDVKKEVKVTREQDKMIAAAMKKMQEDMQAGRIPMNLSDPMAGIDIDFSAILDEAQRNRLDELFLQSNGGFAIADAKIATALELTDEQKSKANQIRVESNQALMDMMPKIRSNAGLKEAQKKREEFGAKILALLTDAQKSKLETMKGKPFKFKG